MRVASLLKTKKNGLAKRWSAQLDLFDHSVLEHTVAAKLLCSHRAPKARCMMQTRQARGLELLATSEVIRDGNVWIVPSQHTSKRYTVNLFIQTCTCPDYDKNGLKCKHIYAAEYEAQRANGLELPEAVPVERRTYPQQWPAYNLAQTNEKARLVHLLAELCKGVEQPAQAIGRPRLPFAEMVFCTVYKVYSMFSSRRFTSDLRDAKEKGFISSAPHFNSVSNYMEMESLTPCLKRLIVESSLPLKAIETDFAVDSSGFSTSTYRSWNETKWGTVKQGYGAAQVDRLKKQEWVKVHVMTGVTRSGLINSRATILAWHDAKN